MAIRRVVPNLPAGSIADSTRFYRDLLELDVVMDHGWIATVADREHGDLQLSVMTHDLTAPVRPAASVEVDDVDAAYARARAMGAEIVHELTDEDWGVRRFFVRDPGGNVINILGHR